MKNIKTIKYLYGRLLWIIRLTRFIPKKLWWNGVGFLAINTLIKYLELRIIQYFEFEITFTAILLALILMFGSSFLMRSLIIIIYNLLRKDFLLIEELKENHLLEKVMARDTSTTRKIQKYKGRGERKLLWILSLLDPVITYVYCRKGHHVWKIIPDMKAFGWFTISVFFCTIELAFAIYFAEPFWNPITELIGFIWGYPYLFFPIFNLIM